MSSRIPELLPSAESGGLVYRKASQILLRHLIVVFAPTGVLVMGLDDTIERRRGKRIAAKGSIVTQFAPVIATWLKPVVCGG